MGITRREFLGTAGAAVTLASLPAQSRIPRRTLGRTGRSVSILAFGSGSRWLGAGDLEHGLALLDYAIDLGINYIDTAANYGDGKSEQWIGNLMPKRRGEVFLATKIFPRKSDEAMRVVEASLKRLQTDHVDLLHVHGLEHDDDLRAIEAPDGLLKLVYKLRDQKVALAAGITSHADPANLKTAIERHDFDCVQMALNAGLTGMKNSTTGFGVNPMDQLNSFESVVLPVAVRKNMGIIAMKVFAQDYLVGKASADKLLGYSLSLPVTTASVGLSNRDLLSQNIETARNFRPLPEAEMRELSNTLSSHKVAIEHFLRQHVDA